MQEKHSLRRFHRSARCVHDMPPVEPSSKRTDDYVRKVHSISCMEDLYSMYKELQYYSAL
jgi:hypothetical protein